MIVQIELKNKIVFVTGLLYRCNSPLTIDAISLTVTHNESEYKVYTGDLSTDSNIIYRTNGSAKLSVNVSYDDMIYTFPFDNLSLSVDKHRVAYGRFYDNVEDANHLIYVYTSKKDVPEIYSMFNDIQHHDGLFFVPIDSFSPGKLHFNFTFYSLLPVEENGELIIKDIDTFLNDPSYDRNKFNDYFIKVGIYSTTYNPYGAETLGNLTASTAIQYYRTDWPLNSSFDFKLDGKAFVTDINDQSRRTKPNLPILKYNESTHLYDASSSNIVNINDLQLNLYPMWVGSKNLGYSCPYYTMDQDVHTDLIALTPIEHKTVPIGKLNVVVGTITTLATGDRVYKKAKPLIDNYVSVWDKEYVTINELNFTAQDLMDYGVYNTNLNYLGGDVVENGQITNFLKNTKNTHFDKGDLTDCIADFLKKGKLYDRKNYTITSNDVVLLDNGLNTNVPGKTKHTKNWWYHEMSRYFWQYDPPMDTSHLAFIWTLLNKLPNCTVLYKPENEKKEKQRLHKGVNTVYNPIKNKYPIEYIYLKPLVLDIYNTAYQDPVLWCYSRADNNNESKKAYGLCGTINGNDPTGLYVVYPESCTGQLIGDYINNLNPFSLKGQMVLKYSKALDYSNSVSAEGMYVVNYINGKNAIKEFEDQMINQMNEAYYNAIESFPEEARNALIAAGAVAGSYGLMICSLWISAAILGVICEVVTEGAIAGLTSAVMIATVATTAAVSLTALSATGIGAAVAAVIVAVSVAVYYGPKDAYLAISYPNVRLSVSKECLTYSNDSGYVVDWELIYEDKGYHTNNIKELFNIDIDTTNLLYPGENNIDGISDNACRLNTNLPYITANPNDKNHKNTSLRAEVYRKYFTPQKVTDTNGALINVNSIPFIEKGYYVFKVNGNFNCKLAKHLLMIVSNGNIIDTIVVDQYRDFILDLPDLTNVLFYYKDLALNNTFKKSINKINNKNSFIDISLPVDEPNIRYIASFGLYKITRDISMFNKEDIYKYITIPLCYSFYDKGQCYDQQYDLVWLPSKAYLTTLYYYTYDENCHIKMISSGYPDFEELVQLLPPLNNTVKYDR